MNFNNLGTSAAETDSPRIGTILGRVLQDDTDFICYQCACVDKPISVAFKYAIANIDKARRMCGAETVNMHLTMGLKSGRAEMATVKPYQEKRNKTTNPKLTARVRELRQMLAEYKSNILIPIVNLYKEADDSLRKMQCDKIEKDGLKSSVIRSGDKDLWFSEGYHMDAFGRMYIVTGYGRTNFREVGNIKPKLIGIGTSWFWHQLIMGDTVDNIPGLPILSARLLNKYLPLKKHNPLRKPASCGQAKAVAILYDVTSDAEAGKRTMEAYIDHYGVDAVERLVEQAFLLWIRKTDEVEEVIYFLQQHISTSIQFSRHQLSRLATYKNKLPKDLYEK